MKHIVDPDVIDYLRKLSDTDDPVIEEMRRYSKEKNIPIIGTIGGRLCQQLAMMSRAKTAFEFGSAFGYSTLWLARGMADGGIVHFSQGDQELFETAQGFLARAGVARKIRFHQADPLDVLQTLDETIDLFLLNASAFPGQGQDILSILKERLGEGGLLIVPNALHGGRVASQSDGAETQMLQIFNHKIFKDPEFLCTINPIRGGVLVALKRKP